MTNILDYKILDQSKIYFDDPKKVKGGSYMALSYINTSQDKTQKKFEPLIIQTPKLNLIDGICKTDTRAYLDLEFDKSHWLFFEFMSGVDEHSIVYIQKNSKRWFNKPFPLDVIDEFYKTPVKSARNKNPPKLRLKLPISKGMINCAIYDSKNNLMTHNEILAGDKAVCVLQLSGLKFLKQQVICEWIPLQIKVFKQSKDNVKGYLIDDSLL